MKKTKDGAFCGSCCKEVIDFSEKSPSEIEQILTNLSRQNTCGRFKAEYVNSPETSFGESRFFSRLLTLIVAILFIVGCKPKKKVMGYSSGRFLDYQEGSMKLEATDKLPIDQMSKSEK